MKKEFTAGPWEIWSYGESLIDVAVGPVAGGLAVAQITTANGHGIHTDQAMKQGQANARLIAQSPKLVEAVERLLTELGSSESDAVAFSRAVLLKIEGEI